MQYYCTLLRIHARYSSAVFESRRFCWSPDGISVLFEADGKIQVSDLSGSLATIAEVGSGEFHFGWTANGVVYVSLGDRLQIASREGTVLDEVNLDGAPVGIVPSNTGEWLALLFVDHACLVEASQFRVQQRIRGAFFNACFLAESPSVWLVTETGIVLLHLVSGESYDLAISGNAMATHAFANGRQSVLYLISASADSASSLSRYIASQNVPRFCECLPINVPQDCRVLSPTVSHSGDFAFCVIEEGRYRRLAKLDLASGEISFITPAELNVQDFSVPGRSSEVYLTGKFEEGDPQLFRLSQPEKLEQISRSKGLVDVAVAPDGESFAYEFGLSGGGQKLLRMDGPRMQLLFEKRE